MLTSASPAQKVNDFNGLGRERQNPQIPSPAYRTYQPRCCMDIWGQKRGNALSQTDNNEICTLCQSRARSVGLMVLRSPRQEAIPVQPSQAAVRTFPYRQGERRTPSLTPATNTAAIIVASSTVPSFLPSHLLYLSLGLASYRKIAWLVVLWRLSACMDLNEGGKQTQSWNRAKYYKACSQIGHFSLLAKIIIFVFLMDLSIPKNIPNWNKQLVLRGMLLQCKIQNIYRK